MGRETLRAEAPRVLAPASLRCISCQASACGPGVRVGAPRPVSFRVPLPRGWPLGRSRSTWGVQKPRGVINRPSRARGLWHRARGWCPVPELWPLVLLVPWQQQSLPRHPLRGGAGSPARKPAQAQEVSTYLESGESHFGESRWRLVKTLLTFSLRFLETVELQISLKNYDPQKDKRFSGTVRLAPFRSHPALSASVRPRLLPCGSSGAWGGRARAALKCPGSSDPLLRAGVAGRTPTLGLKRWGEAWGGFGQARRLVWEARLAVGECGRLWVRLSTQRPQTPSPSASGA